MSASTLIQRKGVDCTIQRQSVTKDSAGGPVVTWSAVGTARIFVQPLNGDETERYGRENNRTMIKGYVDPDADIRKADRIVYGTRKFDIQDIFRPGEFSPNEVTAHLKIIMEETQP